MKTNQTPPAPTGGSLTRLVRRIFRMDRGVCYQCRHYTTDEESRIRLNVNFPVGRCSKGMVLSSGVVRCQDTCGMWKPNANAQAAPTKDQPDTTL